MPSSITSEAEALLTLRGVFDQLPAAVAVLRGERHIFQFANADYAALVGGRPLEGLAVADALPEAVEQGFVDLLDQVFASGEQFVGREVRALLNDGSGVREIYVDFTYQPYRGVGGAVEGILVHAVDVTASVLDRLQLKEALRREGQDRFRQAIDNLLDTVLLGSPVRDADGRIVDFTVTFSNSGPDEIGRRGHDDLAGRTFTTLWPNVVTSGILARYVRVAETGIPLDIEGFSYDDEIGGATVRATYDIRATRLGSDLFVAFRDVTERIRRERALAESRAQLEREHEVVRALQDALLPRDVPSVRGLDVAAAYEAASRDIEVGGDWFDVFVLPDGRVVLALGDVAGKGIDAAQTMVQVRAAGRVAALSGQDAAQMLSSQSALMLALGLGPFATAIVAICDPEDGRLEWAAAGHPPPLLVDGEARFLATAEQPPLGVFDDVGYELQTTVLAPGGRLFLYTDGLVERRGESLGDGLDRLRQEAPVGGTAEAACQAVMARMGLDAARGDDVCVLVLDRQA